MFTHTLTVRFRDLDAMDHVNNATYLTYLEETRLGFSSEMGINWARFREEGFVIARCEIDYRRPALLGDTLNIELWAGDIGRSSFEFQYRITRPSDGQIIAEAKTVQVCYDAVRNRPIRLPERWSLCLARHHNGPANVSATGSGADLGLESADQAAV